MKRFMMTMLVMAMILPAMAQRLAFVKEEGGYTNIRKGPGTNFPIVDKVKDGDCVWAKQTGSGWYAIYAEYGSSDYYIIGYIAASKIVIPRSNGVWKTVAWVKQEGGYTNVRKGPSASSAIVKKVKDGSQIFVEQNFDKSWLRVYSHNGTQIGYISASKVDWAETPSCQ